MTFTHAKLTALFEFLATKNKDILHSENENHFGTSEIEIIIAGNAPNGLKQPAVILEDSEVGLSGISSESLSKGRLCAFHILKVERSAVSTKKIEALKDECELIAEQFLAFLVDLGENKHTYVDDQDEQLFPWFQGINVESVKIQREEGAFSHWHGVRVQLLINGRNPIMKEDDKWDL